MLRTVNRMGSWEPVLASSLREVGGGAGLGGEVGGGGVVARRRGLWGLDGLDGVRGRDGMGWMDGWRNVYGIHAEDAIVLFRCILFVRGS